MASSATTAAAVSPRLCHVAVCTFPFASHPATLLLLAHKIAASAPHAQISFFTTETAAAKLSATISSEGGNVRIFLIDDGLPPENKAVHPLEAMRVFRDVEGESIKKSMAVAEEEVGVKISCVVADAFLSDVCREIAADKGVKWVALWTSAATAMAAHMYTDELRRRIGVEGVEETVDKYIAGFPPIPITDLPKEVLDANHSSPIAEMLHLMPLSLADASAVAMNSFGHLESAVTASMNAAFGDKFLSAGPYSFTLSSPTLGARDPDGCLPWLDTHLTAPSSVVYISFGTSHTPPPEEFTALAEALEAAGVPFLWSLPERFMVDLPEGFTERTTKSGKGKVVPWAPQISVLSHMAVGAQLTHCGWNSVMESIVTGVPIICRPFELAEQMLNKTLVESVWEIGVAVEGGKLTKTAVVRAVERVVLEEEGRGMREKIGVMKRRAEVAAADPNGGSAKNLKKFISIITS